MLEEKQEDGAVKEETLDGIIYDSLAIFFGPLVARLKNSYNSENHIKKSVLITLPFVD